MQNVETTPVATLARPDGKGSAPGQVAPSLFDRALLSLLRWDVEKVAWAVLLIITVLSRTIGLGDRAMSHDESLHTVYAFKLYDGQGYRHDPMMHGPLKFYLTAMAYFMFGANDWSSRISVALFGIAMVWMAWLLRRWIGKTGAFLVGLMFAISPALLFHSRYIRDEVLLCTLLVLLVIVVFRYLETRQVRWLYWATAALALAFTTMEASFIYGAVIGAFLILALAAELWRAPWAKPERRYPFRVAVSVAGPAFAAGFLFIVLTQVVGDVGSVRLAGLAFLGIGLLAALPALALALSSWGINGLRVFPELDLMVLFATLALPFISGILVKPLLGWDVDQFSSNLTITGTMILYGGLLLAVLFGASILIGTFWLREKWLYCAGAFWALELLLFTTFLTNGAGVVSGIIGSLGYWIAQQAVQRGSQPWFYFYRLVPLYEFLPMLLSIGGLVAWLQGKARYQAKAQGGNSADGLESPGTNGQGQSNGLQVGHQDGLGAFAAEQMRGGRAGAIAAVQRSPSAPIAMPVRAAATAPLLAAGLPAGATASLPELIDVRTLLVAFLVFSVAATWLIFTYVGEKMPWHVVYFATFMALLGGWWLGRVIEGIDWRAVRARGGYWFMAMIPLFLVALHEIVPPSGRQPFTDISTTGLSNTAQWILALVVGLVLAYLIWERVVALGSDQTWRLTAVALAVLLGLFTVATAYRLAFVDYDYATEPMVYAHGTPDLKLAMSQIDEISRKLGGDQSLKVAYDDDATWPLEWYLRNYTNRVYFGSNPTREALDAPVVIVGDKNYAKVKPYLGDRYYEFKYRLIWWPRETYKDLTWQKVWDDIRDPVQRGQFWDVVLRRQWTTPTSQWDPVHNFSLYVRKDVAAQVWNWGAPASTASVTSTDPYAAGQRTVNAVLQLGTAGVAGTAPGQFNLPRAVTVGPDGTIYVADSGNDRIQVFSPQGQFLRQWGSTCKLYDQTQPQQGCKGDGQAQFDEPWGIAVDKSGNVYVADTWNSRIQKFDAQGNFITMWGVFDTTQGQLGNTRDLYGPRQLAIGGDGNLYVTDTGNKRIMVFKPDGTFVAQFGGQGLDNGQLDEPTGVAVDRSGNIYIADTWNHRIQKFDSQFRYVAQWPINGWASQTVVNKPAIAVDSARGILYATDPENYRVLAFGLNGTFKATWGQFGNDNASLALPTGIAVGPDGKVYVADGDGHRIMVFPPLQ